MIGQRLAHFQITALLGEGGMGRVYRAEDTKLRREVAIKVLPASVSADAERLERFQREAQTLAALNHPNIVAIHSVEEADGRHFLAMELVAGETLDEVIPDGGLPLENLFDIAIPITDALAQAHAHGITHRDVKPANVMIGAGGRVKVLDFGLAKTATAEAQVDEETLGMTQEGAVVGTVRYMSPEQALGKSADARSDVFSLGVLLYEMATGSRPFGGAGTVEVLSAILKDEPTSVTDVREELPNHLGRITKRCIEKDPAKRYPSAGDVRNELQSLRVELSDGKRSAGGKAPVSTVAKPTNGRRWLIAAALVLGLGALGWAGSRWIGGGDGEVPNPATATLASGLVVLPFENLGPPADEYFATGITEVINSRLAAVRGLRVISRHSAVRYAGTDKSLAEIGNELGISHVLEGTVRWAQSDEGSQVRITPRLTRVSDDVEVWADAYERVLLDVFEVEREIAETVASSLGVALATRSASESKPPTDSPDAYQSYLKSIDFRRSGTPDSRGLRLGMLVRAVEIDPEFVEAWAQLARIYSYNYSTGNPEEDWAAKAEDALARALEPNPEDPFVRTAHGYHLYYVHGEYEEALEIFEGVVKEYPNDVDAASAVAYIYRRQGRLEEAIGALEKAAALDPRDIELRDNIAQTYLAMRRFEEAIATVDKAFPISPDAERLYRTKAYVLLAWTGETGEARRALGRFPGDFTALSLMTELDWIDRDFEAALARLERSQPATPRERFVHSIQTGRTLRLMGRTEQARPYFEGVLAALEQAEGQTAEGALLQNQARLHSVLGNERIALEKADAAISATASDRFSGARAVEAKAWVLANLGRHDEAIALLEVLLSTSYEYPVTRAILRSSPYWDGLRSSPRFEALIAAD